LSKPPTSIFKRYRLVGLAFIHLGVARGLRATFGVFFVALIETFKWSRGATAGALSLSIAFEGVSMPFVGSLTDRLGGRRTLIFGGLVLALGLGLSATVSSLWEFYLWVGIVTSLGMGLIGMVPHVAVLSREFPGNRGTVLGLAYAGGGFGILLLVPFVQVMIDTWGWSVAYVVLAGLAAFLVIVPAQIFFSASSPSSDQSSKEKEIGEEWTVKRALRNSAFWVLFASRVLASMGNQIIVTHQIAHTVDAGYTKLFAATVFGLMGVASIFGRVMFGHLADRMRREAVYTWVQVVSSLGIVSLLAVQDTSVPTLLYAYAILYGLGQGSRALVLSTIFADIFVGKNFGALYGYFTVSIAFGGAIGAWFGGFLHDLTGNYIIAFSIALLLWIVSMIGVWSAKPIARDLKQSGLR